MVSTPNNPGGLFEQIENEPPDQCLYHRMFLDYQVGLGKIYSISDIDKAKQSPSFEREYNLKYGIGTGNVFIGSELDRACSLIKYPIQVDHSNCVLSLGLDPGWGSSRFAATILMLQDDIIKVVYSKEWEKPSCESMIHEVSRLKMQFKPARIYCDGSNPNFIKSLKSLFNEQQDYDKVIERARKSKIEYYKWMYVVPVNFNEYGRELLERLQQFVSRGSFALSSVEHKELVQQMRTAKLKENGNLEKDDTGGATYDSLDSARLAVFPFHTGARR